MNTKRLQAITPELREWTTRTEIAAENEGARVRTLREQGGGHAAGHKTRGLVNASFLPVTDETLKERRTRIPSANAERVFGLHDVVKSADFDPTILRT